MTGKRGSENGVTLLMQSLTQLAHFVWGACESVHEEASDTIALMTEVALMEKWFSAGDVFDCGHRGKLYHNHVASEGESL
jgi:hypothetical protein